MGKIQKIREQKKLTEQENQELLAQKRKKVFFWLVVGLIVVSMGFYGMARTFDKNKTAEEQSSQSASPSMAASESSLPSNSPTTTGQFAVIETAKGNIKLELFAQDAPKTVANFTTLASQGFYNGLKFHRVIPEFMIQGGDPNGDGTGGPGYAFEDEINPWKLELSEDTIKSYQSLGYQYRSDLNSHKVTVGSLAMANAGPNTNGSQFFIVTYEDQPHLNGKHTVFGRVVEGMDVVRKIQRGDIINKIIITQE